MKGKFLLLLLSSLLFFKTNAASTEDPVGAVLHGRVLDAITRQPVSGMISIYLDSDVFRERADLEYGEFSEPLREYGWYLIKIAAKGYVEATDTLWVLNDKRPEIKRDYLMMPQTISKAFENNIYFDRNKSNLSSEAVLDLEKIVTYLNENPDMSCDIEGHADRTGSPEINLAISEDRAYAVYDFLLSKGIDHARLRTFGYGASLSANADETPDALAKSRRVEIIPFKNNSSELFPVFDNIAFDFSKTAVPPQFTEELDAIQKFLNDNPRATCEIAGHTDNIGSATVNMVISQNRAEAVVKYLVSKGIDGTRLKARGYGFSRPMEANASAAARAKNRRVEFNVRMI